VTPPPAGLRAVLFDWDGTLVDSAETSFRCYVRLFQEYGIAFDRTAFQSSYSPNWHRTYTAMGLASEQWTQADARWLAHYACEETELLRGARPALDRLRAAGLTLGVVTSGDGSRVRPELARLGLADHFAQVTCAEDVPQRKPHPAALILALERLGVPPRHAAYVGDSPEDIEMARAAGAYAVGVPGGFPNREALAASGPDLLAPDLPAAVARLLEAPGG
jgi:HAD superfamily hydrolase (TIGR01509 family)